MRGEQQQRYGNDACGDRPLSPQAALSQKTGLRYGGRDKEQDVQGDQDRKRPLAAQIGDQQESRRQRSQHATDRIQGVKRSRSRGRARSSASRSVRWPAGS